MTEVTDAQRSDEPEAMIIRPYEATDAVATLQVFERAIGVTARSRYSAEQVAAWLGPARDRAAWARERAAVTTLVAEVDREVAGFTDIAPNGYVDRLFVDPAFGRRGIGSALLTEVQRIAREQRIRTLSTHASLVARPVFEAAGFEVEHAETVEKSGQSLQRFFMTAEL